MIDIIRGRYDRCFGESNKSSLYIVLLLTCILLVVHESYPDWD